MIKKTMFTMLVFLFTATALQAQTTDENEKKCEWSVEIDPATFAFGGYSLHLRFKPKNSSHLQFGAGAYAMDMPAMLVDLNKKNRDLGWKVRLNQGYGLFGEYYFSEVNEKWFTGIQTGVQEYKIEQSERSGSAKFSNFLAMTYAGYSWKPFKNNFYVKPWAGIGYTAKISGENTLAGSEYNVAPVTFFATFHLGYSF